MAAPNVVSVNTMYGKTNLMSITTVVTAITTCATDKLYKINSLVVANIDGVNNADVTVDILRGGIAYHLARTITVPADATLVVISKDMGIYLEEGDAIRCTASADGDLQAACSYEIIDDGV